MTIEFKLPDIGEGLEEAEVVAWHVQPGDTVRRDQPFVDILTDKAETEMPSPGSGTVVSLGAAVGDIIKVGDTLIVIDDGTGDERSPNSAATAPSAPTPTPTPAQTPVGAPTAAGAPAPDRSVGRRPKAAPSTRRLAVELGVDLHLVTGTGPGGRILAEDVRGAGAASVPTSPPARVAAPTETALQPSDGGLGWMEPGTHPLRGVRRATARAMDLSWSTIPHVTAMDELDATELLLTRARLNDAYQDRQLSVTPLALLLVAVARALRRHPMMNATLDLAADQITVHDRINLGVAVASERGLLVPVVHDADRLSVLDMAQEVARLSQAVRGGSIASEDLAGGTFTVSNYGSNGGYFAAPIIRPGESGIVGFGSVAKRPFVIDDVVEARPVLPVVISADHRLIDGDVLSAFQGYLGRSITEAVSLLVP